MIEWKEWTPTTKLKKGLYLVTITSGGVSHVTSAAYWDAYDKKKWTGFDINENGDMEEVYNVIAYAELPLPY